mgnify:CR=1 FL=1
MEINDAIGMLTNNLASLTTTYSLQVLCKLQNYQPHKLKRTNKPFDDLIFAEDELFYGMDANLACQQQVQQFNKNPTHYSLHYPTVPTSFAEHQNTINRLNEKAHTLGFPLKAPNQSNLVVLGAGLGFHLQHLIQSRSFGSIILLEPNEDMLFHFLSNINVDELNQHCKQNGGQFTIITAGSVQAFKEQVLQFAKTQGFDFFAELSLYRHYETPLFNQIFENFVPIRQQWLSTWGFFDDEIIGLTHTIKNVNNGCHIYTQSVKKSIDTPVVIVGNGPSLDANIKLLSQNQSKFIIASCGTALAALRRNGITPDVHVEMERTDGSYEICHPWLSEQMLKNSTLFALNTVTPKITELFSNKLLFAKANDSGTNLLSVMHDNTLDELYFSNPTVTNFAAASFVSLGFKNLTLLGCDYGFKDPNKHHSASSDYFDKANALSKASYQSEFKVPGNFGGSVGTDRIYNLARVNIEQLLLRNPSVKCRNSSDGAYINGALAEEFADVLKIEVARISKKRVLGLLKHSDANSVLINNDILLIQFEDCLDILQKLKKELTTSKNSYQMQNLLSRYTAIIEFNHKRKIEYYLLSGVLRYFSVTLSSHLNRMPFKAHDDYLHFFKEQLSQFCDHCLESLQNLLQNQKEQVNEV